MKTEERGRCVLVLGGEITSYERIRAYLRSSDYFIFCDAGLKHEKELGVKVDLAVGDFDSIPEPEDVETVVFPPSKDDTDSLCGIKEGIKRGFSDFLIVGAAGGRIDHEIANLYLLDYLDEHSKSGRIVTEKEEIEIVSSKAKRIRKGCIYFSLLAFFGEAGGVDIRGAEYNLEGGVIRPSFQYGISNSVLEEEAVVTVEKGKLLLVTVMEE